MAHRTVLKGHTTALIAKLDSQDWIYCARKISMLDEVMLGSTLRYFVRNGTIVGRNGCHIKVGSRDAIFGANYYLN